MPTSFKTETGREIFHSTSQPSTDQSIRIKSERVSNFPKEKVDKKQHGGGHGT
jgi:hypothetical protein